MTTTYLTDTFSRGSTSVGAAGTTTGVGNGWIDRVGGSFSLSSGVLQDASTGGSSYQSAWLVRPSSENSLSQRIAISCGSGGIPVCLLRVNSAAGYAYAGYYDGGGLTISVFKGSNAQISTGGAPGLSSLILEFIATPNATAGTDLTLNLYNQSAPGTIVASRTVTGDTTSGLQAAGSYGISAANSLPTITQVVLDNGGGAAALSLSPGSSSIVGASATQSLTASLTGSTASLTAAVSGGGTLSTSAPASGTAFTYTAPATGSGTATITVADATDSLTATATVAYTAAAVGVAVAPTSYPLGQVTAFTLTGTNTSWTGSTAPIVTGGTSPFVSNLVVSGQTITGTLNPGLTAGTLTVGTTTDGATATVAAVASVPNKIVFHGDSLTFGQASSNPGGTSTTRLATVLAGLGPAWAGVNLGNAGHTLQQMAGELASAVNPAWDASKAVNVLVVQGGHNDFYYGANIATVIARIQSYVQTALAAHPWRIVWSTEPPGNYGGVFDRNRAAVNAWLRSNWSTLGIAALSDFAADIRMGLDGCEFNTTYYSSDHLHPTDAGYAVWGNYDLGAVASMLAAARPRWSHA